MCMIYICVSCRNDVVKSNRRCTFPTLFVSPPPLPSLSYLCLSLFAHADELTVWGRRLRVPVLIAPFRSRCHCIVVKVRRWWTPWYAWLYCNFQIAARRFIAPWYASDTFTNRALRRMPLREPFVVLWFKLRRCSGAAIRRTANASVPEPRIRTRRISRGRGVPISAIRRLSPVFWRGTHAYQSADDVS